MKIIEASLQTESAFTAGSLSSHAPCRVALMQQQLGEQLALLIEQVALSLLDDEESASTGQAALTDMVAMVSAARQREGRARKRRLLAEDMVFSALRNLDNPDWQSPDSDAGTGMPSDRHGKFLQDLLAWTSPD